MKVYKVTFKLAENIDDTFGELGEAVVITNSKDKIKIELEEIAEKKGLVLIDYEIEEEKELKSSFYVYDMIGEWS